MGLADETGNHSVSHLLTSSTSNVTIVDRVSDRKGRPMPHPQEAESAAEPLAQVQQAAAAHAKTRDQLEQRIREASAAGATLRAIAVAAGISHEQVRRIVAASERHA